MADSYLAPTDLADARRMMGAMIAVRCREQGVAETDEGVVVRLRRGSIEAQLGQITDATVCIVADVALWAADRPGLQALAEAVRPGRFLLFVEPTADLGWRSRLHRSGGPLWRMRFGHDFSADVPAALRAVGLTVTTTDRFGLGRRGIRTYVRGEAMTFSGFSPGTFSGFSPGEGSGLGDGD